MPSKRVADNGMFCPLARRAFQRDFELLTCWVAKIRAQSTVEGISMKRRIFLLPITLRLHRFWKLRLAVSLEIGAWNLELTDQEHRRFFACAAPDKPHLQRATPQSNTQATGADAIFPHLFPCPAPERLRWLVSP
jgi:hypothetical protein